MEVVSRIRGGVGAGLRAKMEWRGRGCNKDPHLCSEVILEGQTHNHALGHPLWWVQCPGGELGLRWGTWKVDTSEAEMASGGGRMRGSTYCCGGWGRRESILTGGLYTPQCPGVGGIHTPWWGSALTIGSFSTHVALHEGDDPNTGCQEAISEPGEEGLEGRGRWERISTSPNPAAKAPQPRRSN